MAYSRPMVIARSRYAEPDICVNIISECCKMAARDKIDYCLVTDQVVSYSKYYIGGTYIAVLRFFHEDSKIRIIEIEHGPFGWRNGEDITYNLSNPKLFEEITFKLKTIFDKNQKHREKYG